MNGQENRISDTPWRERDKLPRPKLLDLTVAALAVLLSSFSLLFAQNEQASFFLLLPLIALCVMTMRVPKNVLLILVTAFLVSLIAMSLSGASVFLALVIGTGALAFSFTVSARPYAALIPLAVSVGAYFVWNDLAVSLLPSVILPAGALLAAATLTHQRRTTAICFTVGGFLISLGTLLAILLYRTLGTLELGAVTAYFEQLRASLTESALLVRDEFFVYMEEALVAEGIGADEIAKSMESFRTLLSDDALTEVLTLFVSILPALAVILSSVVAFFSQLLLSHCYFYRGWRQVLTRDATVFSMSVASAVIYLVSFVCTLFMGIGSLVGAAMQNLCMMLIPGLCVVGFGAVLGMLHSSRGGARFLLIVALCAALCCAGASVFYFLALWGAYTVILSALGQRMMEKMGGNGNGDHGNG